MERCAEGKQSACTIFSGERNEPLKCYVNGCFLSKVFQIIYVITPTVVSVFILNEIGPNRPFSMYWRLSMAILTYNKVLKVPGTVNFAAAAEILSIDVVCEMRFDDSHLMLTSPAEVLKFSATSPYK